jgi:CDP-diacylglycerol--serine O-phosphatidyltransferase
MSLILVLHGRVVPAAWLVFMAVFFDFMDGKVARSLGGGTHFGLEFDSLADVVSFGVAPAVLFYSVYAEPLGVMGALAVSFFALCGALRLARFNVSHVPGPFQGLPIPAGGLFLASFILAGTHLPPWLAALFALGTGVLMVSSVPYSSMKKLRGGQARRKRLLFVGGAGLCGAFLLESAAPLAGISLYVVSGILHFDWEKWLSIPGAEEERVEHTL